MTKTPTVLLLAGALVWSVPSIALASPSARLAVGATVVKSCKVKHDSDSVGLRCSRGGTDRVVVGAAEPRLVSLERDGGVMRTDIDAASDDTSGAERFVTLQF
jgi:hypothetical protein